MRCGTCCKKGGPTLHTQDAQVLERRGLKVADLVTYRKGELAYHPTKCSLIALHTDMIKIKGKNHSLECLFFEEAESRCTIYENRPLECRTLECWNPRPLIDLFLKDLLTRKDIFRDSLHEIIDEYDSLFSPSLLFELLKKGDRQGVLRFEDNDRDYRAQLIARSIVKEEEIDALLGRPLTTIRIALESIIQ